MSIAQQEFTNAGKSMLGRAQASETLHISNLVIGSGGASVPSDLWPLTQLIHQELVANISARRDYGDGTLLVEGSFRSDAAGHAFDLREVGVMAHIGSEADRLYSVANCLTDTPDHVDPASPAVYAFKIKLIIDRIPANQLVLQIGPSENVLGENIGADTVGKGVYKEALGNVLRFKRLVQGNGIVISEDADQNSIKFDLLAQTLQNDLDLYVPMTYPGAPPDACFPTVQAAHDHLLQYMIPTDKFARIHVYKGTYATTEGAIFNHPNSIQIGLLGWPSEIYDATKIEYVDATHKKVTMRNSADMSKFAVGDKIVLDFCHTSWSGGCRITAIDAANRILTCSIFNRSGKNPYSVVNTPDAGKYFKVRLYKTVLKCTSTVFGHGNLQFPYGLLLAMDICAEGGYACFGCGTGDVSLKNCLAIGITDTSAGDNVTVKGFSNAGTGVLALFGQCCCADIVNFGLIGNVFAPEVTIVNGCTAGIVPEGNISIGAVSADMLQFGYPDSRVYVTHCGHGTRAWGSGLNTGNMAYTNNNIGFHVNVMGYVNTGPWGCAGLNNDWDIVVTGMSFVNYQCGDYAFPAAAKVTPTPHQTIPPQPNGFGEQWEGGPANANSYIVLRRDGNPPP